MQSEDLAGLRDVLDVVPYAALIVDGGGAVVYANPRSRRMFAAAPEDLVGGSIHDLVPQGLRPWPPPRQDHPVHRPLDRPLGEGLKVSAVRRDGSTFLADILLSPAPTPGGPYRAVVVKDVALHQELLCGEEHLALSQRVAGIGSWEHDLVTGEVQFSRQLYRLLGVPPDTGPVDITTVFDRLDPVDLPALLAEVERASADGGAFSAWARLTPGPLPADRAGAGEPPAEPPAEDGADGGGARAVVIRGWIDLDPLGRAVRTFGVVQDVTAVQSLQGALWDSARRFQAAFDQAPIGMALVDARPGRPAAVTQVNAALSRVTGRPVADLLAGTVLDLFDPRDRAEAEEHLSAVRAGSVGPAEAVDLRLAGAGAGAVPGRWVSLSGALVRDRGGAPDYLVAHLVDVSARRREEAATRQRAARDGRIAAVLQKALTPCVPRRLGAVGIAWRYRPAGVGERVCGDWVDAFALPTGRIGVVVGDVAGHGVEAAAAMTRLRALVHLLACSGVSPAGVMRRLNDTLHETDLAEEIQLATMVHGQLDPVTGVLQYCSAGHLPMLTLGARPGAPGTMASPVPAIGGPPIGVLPGYHYTEQAVAVEPGSFLVGYTDGLIERRGKDIDTSVLDLLAVLDDLTVDGGRPPDAADPGDLEAIADVLLARAAPGVAEDDTAVIVLAFDPGSRRPAEGPDAGAARRRAVRGLDQVALPPDRWA